MIAVALRDVFQAVIVPRAVNTALRISRYLIRVLWRVWPVIAYAVYRTDDRKREDFFGSFAPFSLVANLVVWVAMLVLGWGLFFYGIRGQLHPQGLTFGACVYYAGASLLTIGYGDVVAVTGFARIMSLLAAAGGLGVLAVVTSFLFAVFGAFQVRETFVVTIGARAGVPPSGVGLLTVHARGMQDELAQVFRDAQTWTARIMESHLAYPVLVMFRSSHDYESWVATLGTLLDAAALILTTIDDRESPALQTAGQARIMFELGRHLTSDFAGYFDVMQPANGGPGVERHEFDDACAQLEQAGYRLREREQSWLEFSRFRSAYGGQLNALARWLEIPPIQWVGDRSPIAPHGKHVTEARSYPHEQERR